MKPKYNPFVRSASLAAIVLTLGTTAKADMFDLNGGTSGFGVADATIYDWHAASAWVPQATANDTGTGTGHATWVNGTRQAYFVGAGTGTTYTVRLGASGSTATTLQNLALNVNQATNGQLAGSAGNVIIGNVGDTGVLSLNAANSIGTYGGTLTVNNPLNLGANRNTNFRGGTVVLNGSISGTGTSGVVLSGTAFGMPASGTLTLAGNNSFAGNTSVNSGYTLNLQHANALGAAGGTNTVNNNGILRISSGASINSGESVTINGAGSDFFGALRAGSGGGTWGGQVTLGDTAVRIGALAAQTLTVTGSIVDGVGTGFNVSGQSGTGVVVLNPTTSNTYTGTTGILRGILRLGKTDALPTGTTLDVDSFSGVSDAATFDMASFNQTVAVLQNSATTNINGSITNSVASTVSTLTVNQASNTDFGGIIENGSGTVALTKQGAGTLTLSGANIYTGLTSVKNGTLVIATNRTASGTVDVGDTAGQTGTLNIQANLPMGGSQLSVGSTAAGATGIVNHSAGTVSFTSGNALLIGRTTGGVSGTYNLSGGTLTTYASASRGIMIGVNAGSADNLISATFNLSGSGILNNATGTLQVVRGDFTSSFQNSTYNQSGGTSTNDTLLIGGNAANGANSTATFSVTGGTFSASTFSNLSRGNNVSSAMTIGGTADVTLPAFPTVRGTGSTATLTFDGGVLRPAASTTAYLGGLTSATINGGGAKFDTGVFDISVSQALLVGTGNGGLTKEGTGTLTLSGASTYTGLTTINSGTLALGATGSIDDTSGVALGGGTFDVSSKSGYTVNNLTGNGNVIGSLTVSTELAIGTSPGTINFENLTMGAGSTYTYELIGGGTDADLANVSGTLNIVDGAQLDLVQLGTFTLGDKFTLFAYETGQLTGTFDGIDNGDVFMDAGGEWLIYYDDPSAGSNGGTGTSFVTITAVPEPSAALLGTIGALLLFRRRR